MSDLSTEIESFSAKRSSLRDKLKKRREAIGSILSQTTGAAASALSEDTKQAPKLPSPPPPVKPEIRKPTPEAEKISTGETAKKCSFLAFYKTSQLLLRTSSCSAFETRQ